LSIDEINESSLNFLDNKKASYQFSALVYFACK
jgi:hypothetical protein